MMCLIMVVTHNTAMLVLKRWLLKHVNLSTTPLTLTYMTTTKTDLSTMSMCSTPDLAKRVVATAILYGLTHGTSTMCLANALNLTVLCSITTLVPTKSTMARLRVSAHSVMSSLTCSVWLTNILQTTHLRSCRAITLHFAMVATTTTARLLPATRFIRSMRLDGQHLSKSAILHNMSCSH